MVPACEGVLVLGSHAADALVIAQLDVVRFEFGEAGAGAEIWLSLQDFAPAFIKQLNTFETAIWRAIENPDKLDLGASWCDRTFKVILAVKLTLVAKAELKVKDRSILLLIVVHRHKVSVVSQLI